MLLQKAKLVNFLAELFLDSQNHGATPSAARERRRTSLDSEASSMSDLSSDMGSLSLSVTHSPDGGDRKHIDGGTSSSSVAEISSLESVSAGVEPETQEEGSVPSSSEVQAEPAGPAAMEEVEVKLNESKMRTNKTTSSKVSTGIALRGLVMNCLNLLRLQVGATEL